jgi:hypothetical protein
MIFLDWFVAFWVMPWTILVSHSAFEINLFLPSSGLICKEIYLRRQIIEREWQSGDYSKFRICFSRIKFFLA